MSRAGRPLQAQHPRGMAEALAASFARRPLPAPTWAVPGDHRVLAGGAVVDCAPRVAVRRVGRHRSELLAGIGGDEAMDQPTAGTMLKALDRFVGEWTMAAGPPGGPPWPGAARVRFEWLAGGAFLLQRWTVDLSAAPDGTAIIGCDAANGTYVQLYSDEREVCRVYEMRLDGGEWTLRREGAPFAQRFTGTFSADGATITGRWELAREGEDWATDFEVIYTRVT